jgi:hypothetical protein
MTITGRALALTTAMPRLIRGQFVDSALPYEIFETNPLPISPQSAKALVIAADTTYGISRSHFIEEGERASIILAKKLDDVTFLRGNAHARDCTQKKLDEFAKGSGMKIIVYFGYGSPEGTQFFKAPDITGKFNGSPLVLMLDHPYSGGLGERLSARHNTVIITNNTARSSKPSRHFLPMVTSAWAYGESLQDAFVGAAARYHAHSLEYRINAVPHDGLRIADAIFRFSRATKQLYANGIDTRSLYIKKE